MRSSAVRCPVIVATPVVVDFGPVRATAAGQGVSQGGSGEPAVLHALIDYRTSGLDWKLEALCADGEILLEDSLDVPPVEPGARGTQFNSE